MKCPVVVVIFLVAATEVAFAQTESARISGRVSDSAAAVIVGAECTITNLETNVSIVAITNGDGAICYTRPASSQLSADHSEGRLPHCRPCRAFGCTCRMR